MSFYDQAARYAAKLDPDGFLRWLLSGLAPGWKFTGWLDTQTIPFPGEPDRRCDTVARLDHAEGLSPPWAVVVELQTRNDPALPDRLLEYLVRLRAELRHGPHGRDRFQLGAALVQLTETAPAVNLDMVLPGNAGVELRWQARVRTMADEDAAAFLAEIDGGRIGRGLLPWAPLMRGGGEATVIAEWKRLGELEEDRRTRGNYKALALVFAELVGGMAAWRDALEGWNVEESPIVREWTARALERGLQQGLEQGRQQGLEQGRQQGKEQGMEIGCEKLRMAVLKTWQGRFAAAAPTEVQAAVQKQRDVDELGRWLDAILSAPSADEASRAILG